MSAKIGKEVVTSVYWKIRSEYFNFGILALFFVLPLYRNYSTIIIGLLLAFSLGRLVIAKQLPQIKFHWFLPTLFIYYLLSVLVSDGVGGLIERRLTMVLIPLLFALNFNSHSSDIQKKIYKAFILGNVVAAMVCFAIATGRSLTVIHGTWHFDPLVIKNSGYDFITSAVMGGNYFFGSELSFFIDSTYFAIYIVISQLLILEILRIKKSDTEHRVFLLIYFFLFIPLFFLSSKSAMVSSVVLALYALLTFKMLIKIRVATIAGLSIVVLIFFLVNPRLKVFIETIPETIGSIDPEARFGHSLRILSWNAAIEVIKENWLVGVGEGKKDVELQTAYEALGYKEPAKEQFNSHNQYLDFLLGGGVIGLGIFMTGMLQLLINAIRNLNRTFVLFLLIILFSAFFENLLTRYAGVVIFTVFITLFTSNISKENQIESKV